jgi:hypothetical protein
MFGEHRRELEVKFPELARREMKCQERTQGDVPKQAKRSGAICPFDCIFNF